MVSASALDYLTAVSAAAVRSLVCLVSVLFVHFMLSVLSGTRAINRNREQHPEPFIHMMREVVSHRSILIAVFCCDNFGAGVMMILVVLVTF